ncbi:tyrosine-type recombinase/integrase [Deinococcus deserti]|nr:site-specific integrase [Deinococcus deserti]
MQPRDRTDAITRRPPHRETVVHRALAAAEREQRTDLRVLILLTAHAGLRIEEALTLTWTQVDLASRRLTVQGKGRKRRIVGISGSLLDALQAHAGQGKGDRLFTYAHRSGATYHLRRLMEQEGLPWAGFHAFRKYNGTLLYRRTRDFVRVAHHLGHANVNTHGRTLMCRQMTWLVNSPISEESATVRSAYPGLSEFSPENRNAYVAHTWILGYTVSHQRRPLGRLFHHQPVADLKRTDQTVTSGCMG